jgi:ADP-heptose:LPS heptosyltransferase
VCRDPASASRVADILDEVAIPGDDASEGGDVNGNGPPIVVIHPGSGDNFPARRWPAAHFADVAGTLHRESGARIIVTGTGPERRLARDFGALCTAPFTDLTGALELPEFVELLARADLLITNDTAPVHISSALRRPLIALYGPNTPDLYGPLNEEARAFYLRFPCSPCITNMNAKTSRCRMPECITQIDPDRVAAAALSMLARHAPFSAPRRSENLPGPGTVRP